MDELYIYLFKVSAGLAIIAIPYYFLLRNDPNLNLKRIYLLGGILASWIFPLIAFRKPEILTNFTPTVFIDPGAETVSPVSISSLDSGTGITFNWIKILVIIYLTGMIFMFLKNLFIIIRWNLTWKRSRDEEGIAFTHSDQVFTLFTKIFIPVSLKDEKDLHNIILHERAHVKQFHFIDLMIMELTLLLTWFNPFSWLISRMIKENHEHLADRQVLSAGIDPAGYRAQLLNHTLGVNVFRLGNQFNHSLTLKRFKMMKKPKNSLSGIIKITLMVPALLISMGLTTGMAPLQQKTVKGKVVIAKTGEPAPGTSIVIANTTVGTVADRDGSFMITVEGNPELVFSFVGYKTLRVKASDIGKKALELVEQTYQVNLDSEPIVVTKKESDVFRINVDGNSDEQPIFVVDGKRVEEIKDIDPESIDKIEVIKDSEHPIAKKYNAKHGVILITGKDGSDENSTLNAKVSQDPDKPVFYVVEDMPMFPGGKSALKSYIYSRLEYPANLKEKGISGEVMVQFLVSHTGELKNIHAVKSSRREFEAPALEVFRNMPDWNPGKQRGKAVSVNVVVPVKFNAEEG